MVTKSFSDAEMVPALVAQRIQSVRSPIPVTAADHAYGALRDAIVALEMAPGERLFRKDLSRILGVSLTPLRDAILRLEAIGLVETRPQAETKVSLLDRQHLFELHFQRVALETDIVRRLARRGNVQATATDSSEAFHRALFDGAGLQRLFTVFAEQYAPMQRCLNCVETSEERLRLDFQRQIIERILSRDRKGAVLAMRAHLADYGACIGEAYRLRPDWFM